MGTHTHTHRQVKMKAKAAIWVTLMQDKAQQGWPASPGSWEKSWGRLSLSASGGTNPTDTLNSDSWPPEQRHYISVV